MLTTSKQMIIDAQNGGYAIGSFNTSDLEITKAIISAATRLRSPVIIETSEKAIGYAGLEELASIIKSAAKNARVPVALHLDHGTNLDLVNRCLEAGYTSIMFDGSKLPYDENQILTRQAAEMAHRKNVPCEGELGSIMKAPKKSVYPIAIDKGFTDPELVSQFVRNTGIDFLAVSIGSQHGIGANEELDIELLKKINTKTSIPLVLHGASGVPERDIKQAVKNGICKINIDTDIRHTFSKAIREITKKFPDLSDPRDIMTKVMAEIEKVVEEKIKLFGSQWKANS
jgi:fructose-bisphosphate aldolase class II